MKGYKGFDKDFKCKGMQYEVGKTFEEKEAVLCEKGLHFCEYPLDVFTYYAPANSKYALIKAENISKQKADCDSKRVCKKLEVEKEISLLEIAKESVKYIKENLTEKHVKTNIDDQSAVTNIGDYSAATNTGNQSVATNTGDFSAAANTGYCSIATNTGYKSIATNTGKHSAAISIGGISKAAVSGEKSVAVAIGPYGMAKGSIGCWLVLSEFEITNDSFYRKDVKVFYVDGKKIKADTFYTLKNEKAVPADEE